MIAPPDRARIDAINAELDTIRIGRGSAIDDVLPAARRLLDLDNLFVYSISEQLRGWQLDHWHHDGSGGQIEAPFRALLASAPQTFVLYDPSCLKPSMRNRPVEATAWIDRDAPGTWLQSPMCDAIFVPHGMQHHKQLRILLCDRSDLLGWFGTIAPGAVARRHYRLLGALAPAMRRRLAIERHLAAGPRTFHALEVALDRIGAPAFVVTARGAICEANAAARVLLDQRRREIAVALADARAGRPNPIRIELTPVTANGAPDAWLAILRADTADARVNNAIAVAAARWSLTRRQRDVLEHIIRGDPNATIAAQMNVSSRAVELHVTAMFDRVGVDNRAALVAAVLAGDTQHGT